MHLRVSLLGDFGVVASDVHMSQYISTTKEAAVVWPNPVARSCVMMTPLQIEKSRVSAVQLLVENVFLYKLQRSGKSEERSDA